MPEVKTEKTVEELHAEVVQLIKDQQVQTEKQLREIEEKGKANETLAGEIAETKSAIERLKEQIERLRMDVSRPGDVMPDLAKTAGAQVIESDKWKEWANRGYRQDTLRIDLKGLFPTGSMEQKTTVTSSAVGSATSGILVPQRVQEFVNLPHRRLTLRDLLPSRAVTSNAIEYPKMSTVTSAASPQVEGSDKGESAMTFTIGTANIRTIAHWIPATAQVLDDWPYLGRLINDELLYQLKLKEEAEILSGSGSGVHLSGLTTNATAYADTYNATGDTYIDTLRHAITEIEDGDEEMDFFVIHPSSWDSILGVKEEANGVGGYVYGLPAAMNQPTTLWGKTVIVTNSMTSGYFLAGNSRMAEVFDRMQATIAISSEHYDYFIKNLLAIRCEERIGLAVYRSSAFCYGSIS